jgi:hypothetical protein
MKFEIEYEIEYTMDGNVVDEVSMKGDGLRVELVCVGDGEFTYHSWDRDQKLPSTAPHLMSLPTCLLHAAEFFGMIPPGTIKEDVYDGCEYRF